MRVKKCIECGEEFEYNCADETDCEKCIDKSVTENMKYLKDIKIRSVIKLKIG